jgi:hypothetical protein
MTMTDARQIVSFTLSSLFAHCGYCRVQMTKTAYERELDRLLDASEDEPPAARRQVGMLRKSAWWV